MKETATPLVGIVGPCGSGKSTLANLLTSYGIECRHIAQEHSYVPTMWKVISKPDVLVYLLVSYENTIARRQLNWTMIEYEEQLFRLRHAKDHADLLIDTNLMTPEQVFGEVISFLNQKGY